MALSLNTPAFARNQPIPNQFSRDGGNVSPPIEWQGAPTRTRSFALVVEDPDAPKGTFRHWAAYDIPPDIHRLAEGEGAGRPKTSMEMAVNDFGNAHYDGPQPPSGHGTHHYHFRLFALDVPKLNVPKNCAAQDVLAAVKKHILEEAEVIGTFER